MKLLVLALCVCAASAASTFSRPSTLPKATLPKPLQKPTPSKPASAPLRLKANATPTPAPTPTPTFAPTTYAPTTAQPEQPKPSYQPVALAAKRLPEPNHPVVLSNQPDKEAEVLHSELESDQNGYKYSYETGNGISGGATGTLTRENDVDFVVVEGRYQYPGPNGPIEVTFTADKDGYHPQSDILPTSPPVPPYVLRLVQYLEEHATPQE